MIGGDDVAKFFQGLGWFFLLIVRGLALWVLIPMSFLAWLMVHSWAQRASLGQAISWYDGNFCLLLINGPLRPLVRLEGEARFHAISQMRTLPPFRLGRLFDLV